MACSGAPAAARLKLETWRSGWRRVRGPTQPKSQPRAVQTSSYHYERSAPRTNFRSRFDHGNLAKLLENARKKGIVDDDEDQEEEDAMDSEQPKKKKQKRTKVCSRRPSVCRTQVLQVHVETTDLAAHRRW